LDGNGTPMPTYAGDAHDGEVLSMDIDGTEMRARFGFCEAENRGQKLHWKIIDPWRSLTAVRRLRIKLQHVELEYSRGS
jgi:hypothetical protein